MSEEGSEGEIVKEEPKEEPGKRFFLSHLNSYTGKALLKELINEHLVKDPAAAHIFTGTLKEDEPDIQRLREHIPTGVS